MKKHKWKWRPDLSDLASVKSVGGVSQCVNCDLFRFTVAGNPPSSHYLTPQTLLENRTNRRIAKLAIPNPGCGARHVLDAVEGDA